MGSSTQTLVLPLTNQRSRQIFLYNNGNDNIRIMYDSGAKIPVWCTGEELLKKSYPESVKVDLSSTISGFGTGSEKGDVYIIPKFEISDGTSHYVIRNLTVISILKPNIGCDLLISETMFTKADTTTFRRKKRELSISYDDRDYYCTSMRRDGSLIDITVWMQNRKD